MINYSIAAKRITELREEHGLKQWQLGEKVGVQKGAISQYENHGRGLSLEKIIQFADFFQVSPDYILGRSSQRNPIPLFTRRLEELLAKHDLTADQLLQQLRNQNQNLFSAKEVSPIPSVEVLLILADHFGTSLDDLVGRTPPTAACETSSIQNYATLQTIRDQFASGLVRANDDTPLSSEAIQFITQFLDILHVLPLTKNT